MPPEDGMLDLRNNGLIEPEYSGKHVVTRPEASDQVFAQFVLNGPDGIPGFKQRPQRLYVVLFYRQSVVPLR